MYSGGNVLEEVAVARAEGNLCVLVNRAPRAAHRRIGERVACAVSSSTRSLDRPQRASAGRFSAPGTTRPRTRHRLLDEHSRGLHQLRSTKPPTAIHGLYGQPL